MKWLLITFSIVFLLLSVSTVAQAQSALPTAPAPSEITFSGGISPGAVTPTPEMWFYQQELRRYEDPKTGVRRNAELQAAERRRRIAARRWLGFSNARPTVGSDRYHPFRRSGQGPVVIMARPNPTVRTY